MKSLYKVLDAFINPASDHTIEAFGSGLIHHTYVVKKGEKKVFILQEVNHTVFKWPDNIADNIDSLSSWLKKTNSDTILASPLQTKNGQQYYLMDGAYYRLIPFVEDTHSINVCNFPEQAYEASKQFGNFTASFNGFPVENLKPTIVGFHDLVFRWKQFRESLTLGNTERIKASAPIIAALEDDYTIVSFYEKILNARSFLSRVTHHDTKISNVLFNSNQKGVCVIDLDTVMPGFFISDLGDMFRTYLSPANEEEKDMQLVEVRSDFYQAIIEGYKEKMADQMSTDEIHHLNYAGEFMIYMQALRFFTDYLNNDVYYNISYPDNNLTRTKNQLKLLKSFRGIIA
jgi:Ser/Thr protein kinase RdoA (MazF antagonist)